MAPRTLLVGLIVLATALFVIGTVIERNSSGESAHHNEAAPPAMAAGESAASAEAGHSETGGESAATRARENPGTSTATGEKPHAELRPLGIDVEASPFVTLAAVVSLALAAAAWLRPRAVVILALVAVAMLAFATLDVRDIVHQVDIDESGLAVMAGAIAALHLAAAGVGAVMTSRAGRPHAGRRGGAGTMPA